MDCGRRLKEVRENKKMSIYRLSQISGISQGHISDLENGRNQPTIDTLKRLLDPIGITLSDFFNENGNAVILSEREKEIITNFRMLPAEKAELYLQLGIALNQK